jgi:hypothetical protein
MRTAGYGPLPGPLGDWLLAKGVKKVVRRRRRGVNSFILI